jgi:putative flippase GtrA
MHFARALARHQLTWVTVRYAISGCIVAAFYLGTPVVFNGALGVPIEFVIPPAYVLAACLQFTLQRVFVFRHVGEFALSIREQAARYVVLGSIQYPTTAGATALLPLVFGIPQRVAFVASSLLFSLCFFIFVRGSVFHPSSAAESIAAASMSGCDPDLVRSCASTEDLHRAEIELVGARTPAVRELQGDPVQT